MIRKLFLHWKRLCDIKRLVLTEGHNVSKSMFKRDHGRNDRKLQVIYIRKPLTDVLKVILSKVGTNNLPGTMAEEIINGGNVLPPETVRGMTELDKTAFKLTTQVPCFMVPVKHMNLVLKRFRKSLLKLRGIKPIADLEEDNPQRATYKLFLLNPGIVSSPSAFSVDDKEFLIQCGVEDKTFRWYEITLSYDNWGYEEILDAVLPKDGARVAGFSKIGHIVHLNLRDELTDYKKIIGQVILDKVSATRTVVNKLGVIDNTYRNFSMEILAGDDDMVTSTKEWDITYKFDFSKVYWNPRLSAEHKRVVDDLQRGDVAYDIFAGVGPFAIPAAKRGVTVLANDLNPDSYKWLNVNASGNLKTPMRTFNMDGREFIKDVVKQDLLNRWKGSHKDHEKLDCPELNRIHFFMNLPALAIEFLDVFPGLFEGVDTKSVDLNSLKLPQVYCYCFSKSTEPEKDAKERIEQVLGCQLGPEHQIRTVRNVAPNKEMLCVIFTLQKAILFGGDVSEPVEKRMKIL